MSVLHLLICIIERGDQLNVVIKHYELDSSFSTSVRVFVRACSFIFQMEEKKKGLYFEKQKNLYRCDVSLGDGKRFRKAFSIDKFPNARELALQEIERARRRRHLGATLIQLLFVVLSCCFGVVVIVSSSFYQFVFVVLSWFLW